MSDLTARAMAKKAIDNTQKIYIERNSSSRFSIWHRPAGGKWTRYEFVHYLTASTSIPNQDVWRLSKVEVGDIPSQDLSVKGTAMVGTIYAPCVPDVQWEYAIQPQGEGDFMGGYHGDEILQAVTWLYDGVSINVTGLTTANIACNRFEMVQHTFLYSPADHTTKYAEMFVRHIFTADGLELKWELRWSASVTVEAAYGAMLPAFRQDIYSSKCRFLDFPTVYDISTTTFAVNPYRDTYGIELTNAHSNRLLMSVEMLDLSFFNGYANAVGRGLWVTNDASYNKVYPSRVYAGTEAVTNTTIWKCDAKYKIFMPSA